MTIPFQRTATTVRDAGAEAAALAHHLVRYPTGIPGERRPARCPDRPAPPGVRPGGGPVLLLHGLADNRAVFTPLRRALHRDGWTHLHALNHSPLTRDVRAAAVLLAHHVARASRAHDDAPVALIGHSLGGLIARYYVQRLGGHELVRAVITLATPHEGTTVALLPSPFPITRQLRPDSDLLTELRSPAPHCTGRFTAVRAGADEIVLPRRNARLDHPDLDTVNVSVPGAGHVGLPAHPRTVAAVREALEHWAAGPLTERHAC